MSETSLNQMNDYRETAFKVRLRRFYALLARLCSNPTTVIGLIIIGLMMAMAIFAPWITEANVPDPYQMPRDWSAVRKPPGTQGFLWVRPMKVVMSFMGLFGKPNFLTAVTLCCWLNHGHRNDYWFSCGPFRRLG